MQQTALTLLWLTLKLLVVIFVVAAIIAAITVNSSVEGLKIFNSIFQIIT